MFYNKKLTRAQIMQLGMELIRDAAGDGVFILGCGAPLASVIGHVQANRVSAGNYISMRCMVSILTANRPDFTQGEARRSAETLT